MAFATEFPVLAMTAPRGTLMAFATKFPGVARTGLLGRSWPSH
jgi:hypothetical protein